MSNSGAIAPPQPHKQRFLGRASLSHPLNSPNSDRTPSTPQTAIALPQLSKQRTPPTSQKRSHSLTPQTAIAPLNLPNSDRTLQLSKQRSHPSTLQTAIASLQLPKQRSHPLNLPNSDRTPSISQTVIAPPHPDFSQVKKIIDKERKKGSLFDT
ncbi:MAG: hypothetical protein HEQ13_17990 [Dolichospermum sp. DEX189]|uniref:Uncharacterized protein n=1 Tax=Aphanizomenon flos-aquae FACHB-1040 TaxID=2692887 RepID=A0ABR8C257_APHFL|nr:hypothetical protein [Aphanizomenon flos-aquae]MBD2280932.1 hypothetical protein [Aphanizomenon flos-aquae FACHB-1040]MBO1071133.1 hypothetical protein [Dolichospermum sp. DEX189]